MTAWLPHMKKRLKLEDLQISTARRSRRQTPEEQIVAIKQIFAMSKRGGR